MSYRTDKLMIGGHTDTHTHAGNDNTRRPKLASVKYSLKIIYLKFRFNEIFRWGSLSIYTGIAKQVRSHYLTE